MRSADHHPGVLLLALLAAAALAACSDGVFEPWDAPPLGEGVYVPASWRNTRTVPGHAIHVVQQKIPCSSCHTLTKESLGEPTPDRCAVCHAAQARVQHARTLAERRFGAGVKADCTACHVFALGGAAPDAGVQATPSANDCRRCHGGGLHGAPAVVAHATSDCLECHRPHSDRLPQPHACETCHARISTTHAAAEGTTTTACTTCHQNQHGRSDEALASCQPCHAQREPRVPETALFDGGHRQCVGCHRPHGADGEPESVAACTECHAMPSTLGARHVRQHADCQSCHSPHDVRGGAGQACAKCHTQIAPDHPKQGRAGTCVGCHAPHPPPSMSHARAKACSTCHQVATSDAAFHGGTACRTCHEPHAFVAGAGDLDGCSGCHAGPVQATAVNRGHRPCESCHQGLPHRPTGRTTECSTCHAGIATDAHPGHAECRSCHEPHGGAVKKPCQSCHAREHRSAPRGHGDCTQCHDRHTTSAALAACGGCHARQAATPHGRIGSDCSSCHRAHGPKGVASPPRCTSCHQTGALPGLHAIGRHQECRTCHSDHGELRDATRATCASCHRDRKDHYPSAPSCGSCHLFGPAP